MIRYLWYKRTDSIHNMCVVNNDTYSYAQRYPLNVLLGLEKDKIGNNWLHALISSINFPLLSALWSV